MERYFLVLSWKYKTGRKTDGEWKDTFISFPFLEFFLPEKYKTEKSDGVMRYILPIVAGWTVADGKAPWN